jgi:hypothetical protein
MTALQIIIKEAKVIWKKHPKLSWQEAIKKASTIYKSKHKPKKSGKAIAGKRIVKKSVPKKSTPKKVATKKSTHKDTKSHNVNIRVVSGINNIDRLKQAIRTKEGLESNLKIFKSVMPKNRSDYHKMMLKALPQLIAGEKRIISELKKHIK